MTSRRPRPAIGAAELLTAWEEGSRQSPARRALTLLALLWPDLPIPSLAALPIGERDGRLLSLREMLFGPRLTGVTVCPKCGERLELECDVSDLRAQSGAEIGESFVVAVDGYEIMCRLPTTGDLLAITERAGSGAEPPNVQDLAVRCVLSARFADHEHTDGPVDVAAQTLPDEVIARIAARMAEIDPQGDVQFALVCTVCHYEWTAGFDATAFLWSELEDWARHMLWEVHRLAASYGWREADILAMSAPRRRVYLQMIGA